MVSRSGRCCCPVLLRPQCSSDGTIRMWDTVMGKPKGTLRGVPADQPVMCCDIRGGLVAGGANDKAVRVWDMSTERVRVRCSASCSRRFVRALA